MTINITIKKITLQKSARAYLLEGLLKGESLYPYEGITYSGGGSGSSNKGGGGGGGGGDYGGGGGNGPRKRLRKEPREILPTEKKKIPFKAPNTKWSACGGNKRT